MMNDKSSQRYHIWTNKTRIHTWSGPIAMVYAAVNEYPHEIHTKYVSCNELRSSKRTDTTGRASICLQMTNEHTYSTWFPTAVQTNIVAVDMVNGVSLKADAHQWIMVVVFCFCFALSSSLV